MAGQTMVRRATLRRATCLAAVVAVGAVMVSGQDSPPPPPEPVDVSAQIAQIDTSLATTATTDAVLLLVRQQQEQARLAAQQRAASSGGDPRVPHLLAVAVLFGVGAVVTAPRPGLSRETDLLAVPLVGRFRKGGSTLTRPGYSAVTDVPQAARRAAHSLWADATSG